MTSEPLISIIIGVYNKMPHLRACLESVFAQTYPHFEVIVVDDASTDNSLEIINSFTDPRLRIIARQQNSRRPAIPRNTAMREAKGDYIAFLDADDLWYPDKLAVQLTFMQEHPDYLFSHAKCHVISEAGDVLYTRHDGCFPPDGRAILDLFRHCFISISTFIMTRACMDAVGYFSEAECYRGGEDYHYFMRCAALSPFGAPEPVLGAYRHVPTSISREEAAWQSTPRDFFRQNCFFRDKALWEGHATQQEIKDILQVSANENAHYRRQRGEWGKAAWFALRGIRLFPFRRSGWANLGAAILRRP